MRNMMLLACAGLAACGQNATTAPSNDSAAATPTSEVSAPAPAESAIAQPKVTKAQVAQLKEGMTYDEVKALLGREGVKGTAENGTESISWANNDGSSLQTTFTDGKLVVFSDFGMK